MKINEKLVFPLDTMDDLISKPYVLYSSVKSDNNLFFSLIFTLRASGGVHLLRY